MAAKFFTGIPMDGPDPECVQGHGERALATERTVPAASQDHSRRALAERAKPIMLQLRRREDLAAPPVTACAEDPLAGFRP